MVRTDQININSKDKMPQNNPLETKLEIRSSPRIENNFTEEIPKKKFHFEEIQNYTYSKISRMYNIFTPDSKPQKINQPFIQNNKKLLRDQMTTQSVQNFRKKPFAFISQNSGFTATLQEKETSDILSSFNTKSPQESFFKKKKKSKKKTVSKKKSGKSRPKSRKTKLYKKKGGQKNIKLKKTNNKKKNTKKQTDRSKTPIKTKGNVKRRAKSRYRLGKTAQVTPKSRRAKSFFSKGKKSNKESKIIKRIAGNKKSAAKNRKKASKIKRSPIPYSRRQIKKTKMKDFSLLTLESVYSPDKNLMEEMGNLRNQIGKKKKNNLSVHLRKKKLKLRKKTNKNTSMISMETSMLKSAKNQSFTKKPLKKKMKRNKTAKKISSKYKKLK